METETPAYEKLVKLALSRGYSISVNDGEAWAVKRSKDEQEILDAIVSVEEAQLRIRAEDKHGWALVIPYGVAPDETVADYGECALMESLMNEIE